MQIFPSQIRTMFIHRVSIKREQNHLQLQIQHNSCLPNNRTVLSITETVFDDLGNQQMVTSVVGVNK